MDNNSTHDALRVSALASVYKTTVNENAGVTLSEVPDLTLWQLAVWPDSLARVGGSVVNQLALPEVPGFGRAVMTGSVALLRVEPLKFWAIGAALSELDASDGAVLDLSHSRTHVRITGRHATTLLNSYLPLDLREQAFPEGAVASSAFHHVGVTLWRSEAGYELFIPRGFALSLWELLLESAAQYDVAVV